MKLARLHAAAAAEPYWHVQLAVLIAVALQFLLNNELTFGSKYIVGGFELLLLGALITFATKTNHSVQKLRRGMAIALIAIISLANISSLILIIDRLLHTQVVDGKELLISGLAIYLTNIIIFGIWYWELDDPDGHIRRKQAGSSPDFLFPQANLSEKTHWSPTFFDYLYVSITNASAFSPTDTLPLSHRAKLLMTLQSLTSLVTIALVAARAVNILS